MFGNIPLSKSGVFWEEQLDELVGHCLDLHGHLDPLQKCTWREVDLEGGCVADSDLASILSHCSHLLFHPGQYGKVVWKDLKQNPQVYRFIQVSSHIHKLTLMRLN